MFNLGLERRGGSSSLWADDLLFLCAVVLDTDEGIPPVLVSTVISDVRPHRFHERHQP